MQENNIDRVHRLAGLLIYDLELPDSVRHPVRFFAVNDILRAAGLPPVSLGHEVTVITQIPEDQSHAPACSSCNCRFCATGLFDTRILKRPLP